MKLRNVVIGLVLVALVFGTVAAQDETALRWRTRPDNQAEIDVYQTVSDGVDEAWEGVTLQYEPGGTETAGYQATLLTEVAAGTAPDVFWIPGTDVATFALAGAILNLNELVTAADFDVSVFYPQQVAELTYNPETMDNEGALWGLPRDASAMVLYYNADLFDEAGVEYPDVQMANGTWDWDALRETAEAIAALSSGGNQIYGVNFDAWWGPLMLWINAAADNGYNNYFNEARTECGLNSPATTEALTFLRGLYADELAVPFGTSAEPAFVAGQVGMYLNGRWATPNNITNLDFNWNAAEVPAAPNGGRSNWLFWGAYVVNANTEHPEEAFDLVTRLTSVDVQSQITALGANIPSRAGEDAQAAFLDSLKEEKADLNNQAFLNGLQYAVAEAPLWGANFQNIDGAVSAEIGRVMAGEVTPEDFTATVCDLVNPFFSEGS